jgi:hypothetical protein
MEVRQIWTGTRWFIEGDISQYFDSIDHTVLLKILGRNIQDNRFLQLVQRLLQAGYVENWKYARSLSGTPQGAVLSPLLSNLYLHEFDQYITSTLIPAYTKGIARRNNPAYQQVSHRLHVLKDQKGNGKQVRRLRQAQRKLSSKDPYDPGYRRLRYVRYADDFLLGFIGSKREAEQIKGQLKEWLKQQLNLSLSEEKTLITNATHQPASFLGYQIVTQLCHTKCTGGKRSANGRIALRVPASVIEKKCQPYLRNGKPIHLPERTVESDFSIVLGYQQEYRGLVQYYQLATNVCHLDKLRWVMESSLLKTLAAKHRSSVAKQAAKYGATITTPDGRTRSCLQVCLEREGKPPLKAQFGGIPLKRQLMAILDERPLPSFASYSELEQRLRANACEACGSENHIEVHHIRKMADATGKGGRTVPAWRKHMMAIRRKTLVLCRQCHVKLHQGKFDSNFEIRR